MPSHRELELRRGLPLRDPDDEHLEDVLERAVRGLLCGSQLRELLGVLGPSEPLDLFPHPREPQPIEPLLPSLELRDRDGMTLEPQPLHAESARVFEDRHGGILHRRHPVEVRDLVAGLLVVPPVGEVHRAGRPYERHARRAREPRQVPNVRELADEQRVDLQFGAALRQSVPPRHVIHGIASRAR